MFRRLYWIVEQVGSDGKSRVTGVYTSIPDLVERGLQWSDDVHGTGLRVSLVKPDTFNAPLGCWTGPEFPGMVEDLRSFVASHEITEEELNTLSSSLFAFAR